MAAAGEKSFYDYFQEQVDLFRSKTKDWEENKVLSLTEEIDS